VYARSRDTHTDGSGSVRADAVGGGVVQVGRKVRVAWSPLLMRVLQPWLAVATTAGEVPASGRALEPAAALATAAQASTATWRVRAHELAVVADLQDRVPLVWWARWAAADATVAWAPAGLAGRVQLVGVAAGAAIHQRRWAAGPWTAEVEIAPGRISVHVTPPANLVLGPTLWAAVGRTRALLAPTEAARATPPLARAVEREGTAAAVDAITTDDLRGRQWQLHTVAATEGSQPSPDWSVTTEPPWQLSLDYATVRRGPFRMIWCA
jgi:hypothetical protein